MAGFETHLLPLEATLQESMSRLNNMGREPLILFIADAAGHIAGTLTDGDIRRGLSKGVDFLQRPVCELMTKSPKTITEDKLAAQALHLMESNKPKPITVLPVIDKDNKVIGLLHMTDLVRQGVV